MMACIGKPGLADDPRFGDNIGRVAHAAELDAEINAWTSRHPSAHVLGALDRSFADLTRKMG